MTERDESGYVPDKTITDQGKETDAHKAQQEAGKDQGDNDSSESRDATATPDTAGQQSQS